jgi:ABC-type antimicrobial peptide transport system permease subunit
VPRLTDISVNVPVAAFTFVAVLATALLCGASPIRYVSNPNVIDALKDAARSTASKESYQARSLLLVAVGRTLAGIALGVIAAIAATRGIRSLLVGVGTLDVTTYGAVIALVLVVVTLASYFPARLAAAIDPLASLRGE